MRTIAVAACALALSACQTTTSEQIEAIATWAELVSTVAGALSGAPEAGPEGLDREAVQAGILDYCRQDEAGRAETRDQTDQKVLDYIVEEYGGEDGDVCTVI